jgi:NAD(P)H-hydrate epimerase
MRQLDAHAIDTVGIPGIVLMENAARAVLETIEDRYGDVDALNVAVVCGPGNNGGDGFAIARQLLLRGADVDVFFLGEEKQITGDALTNFLLLDPLGLSVVHWHGQDEGVSLSDYDLIVDAIFGTGNTRAPSGVYQQAIEAINESAAHVVSVDVPSGVDATSGSVPGIAVEADVTVTFQQVKCGLMLPPGRNFAGDLIASPISIPDIEEVLASAPFALPEDADILENLPARPREAHKGIFGNLLIIAGSRGMSGAARLMSLAALRCGVGLVKVATPESIRAEVATFRPEVMTIGLPETASGAIAASALETLQPYLEWANCIAIGPGMGTDAETAQFLAGLFAAASLPMVIDADALNIISANNLLDKLPKDVILTPHPGEFDRLTGRKHTDLQERIVAAAAFAEGHGLNLVLKGAPTVCFDADGFGVINPTGNPGLATAGSGDVLAGIIGALRTQGLESYTAAWVGCYLHGRAADLVVESAGTAMLVAGDVITYLPPAFGSVQPKEAVEEGESSSHHGCDGHCNKHHS